MSKQEQEVKKEDFAVALFKALEVAVKLNHNGYKKQTAALIRQHFPGLRRKVNEALNIPRGPEVNPEVEKKTWVHPDILAKEQEEVIQDNPAVVAEEAKQPANEGSKNKASRTAGRKTSSRSKRTRTTKGTDAK